MPEEIDKPELAVTQFVEPDEKMGENNFRHFAEALPLIVWTARPDGTIDYISPQWEVFCGLDQSSEEYLNWSGRVHPEDIECTFEAWAGCVESGEIYEREFRLKGGDGEYYWFSARAVPVKNASDKIVKWYGTTSDVHVVKSAQLLMENLAEEKDNFLAMLGHELRNPLATISTGYRTLERLNPTKKQSEVLDLVGRQVEHLRRLVDDTLDISRLGSGKFKVSKSHVNMRKLVEEVVGDFSCHLFSHQVHTEIDSPADKCWVFGDSVRLSQCLGNLLSNAIKFTPSGGRIDIELGARDIDKEVVLTVRDSGTGMPSAELERIFEPFEQGKSAKSYSKDGLGLGLAIISKVLALHSGSITAKSEGLNEGSEFKIILPTIEPQVSQKVEKLAPGSVSSLEILLVEDNQSVGLTMKMFLEMEGHKVGLVEDGKQAIERLSDKIPAVLLSDITLPGDLLGWDIAEFLTQNTTLETRPYMIALSGHTQPHHLEKSKYAGFHSHMAKPPQLDQLRLELEKAQQWLVSHRG